VAFVGGVTMTDIDFLNAPKSGKIFGTVDCAVALSDVFAGDEKVNTAFSTLQQVPMRFYRDNVIACEGDRADNVFFLVRGVARTCKNCRQGVRNIVAFYLPGDFFGWTELKYSLSIEAATDLEVLFIKRSALLALGSRDAFVGRFLLRSTTNELMRAQDHILLMSKMAKCRVATFLNDLWVRLGRAEYLDIPMSHQDIADHLGLTIETVSRTIAELERSKMITRVSSKKLLIQSRLALGHMMN
jgi:CRP/FNR family transcriptional regulator, nitrogen fixation regulation protein